MFFNTLPPSQSLDVDVWEGHDWPFGWSPLLDWGILHHVLHHESQHETVKEICTVNLKPWVLTLTQKLTSWAIFKMSLGQFLPLTVIKPSSNQLVYKVPSPCSALPVQGSTTSASSFSSEN